MSNAHDSRPTDDSSTLGEFADLEDARPKYDVAALSRLTGLSPTTVRRHLADWPHQRCGRLIRFSARQVEAIIRGFTRDRRGVN